MKKLYYVIPHFILITLLLNKKIVDEKQTKKPTKYNSSRYISGFFEENLFSKKKNVLINTQKSGIKINRLSLLNENFFNQTDLSGESRKKVAKFSLSTEKNFLLSNYFNSNLTVNNPSTKGSIELNSKNKGPSKVLMREL